DRDVHTVARRAALDHPTVAGRNARQVRHEVRVEHVTGHHEVAGTALPVARTDRDPDVPPVGDPAERRGRLEAVRALPRGLPADRSDAGGPPAATTGRGPGDRGGG